MAELAESYRKKEVDRYHRFLKLTSEKTSTSSPAIQEIVSYTRHWAIGQRNLDTFLAMCPGVSKLFTAIPH
jgi:hypothetical protein